MVLHLEVKLFVRRDGRVVDEKDDNQLFRGTEHGIGRRLDFPGPDDIRPFDERRRRRGLGSTVSRSASMIVLVASAPGRIIRDAQGLPQHRGQPPPAAVVLALALPDDDRELVLPGRQGKPARNPHRLVGQRDRINLLERDGRSALRRPRAARRPAARLDGGLTRARRAHVSSAADALAARGAIVTMNGTNVPVWALRKSLCQASVKSAGGRGVRRRVGERDDRLAFLTKRLFDAFELAAIGRLRSEEPAADATPSR